MLCLYFLQIPWDFAVILDLELKIKFSLVEKKSVYIKI